MIEELVKRLLVLESKLREISRSDKKTSSSATVCEVGADNVLAVRTTYCKVKPNADGASSDVEDITLANDGLVVTFTPYASSKTLVFKDNTVLKLNGDCTLSTTDHTLTLICDRDLAVWKEVA